MTREARLLIHLVGLFVNIFRTSDAISRNKACDAFEREVRKLIEEADDK